MTNRPATVYRCRCASCGWVGYRKGYFLVDEAGRVGRMPEDRIHVDSCPNCAAENVQGLSPKVPRHSATHAPRAKRSGAHQQEPSPHHEGGAR